MFDEDMERRENLSSGAKGDIFFKEKMVIVLHLGYQKSSVYCPFYK